jgi:hypothetical protein
MLFSIFLKYKLKVCCLLFQYLSIFKKNVKILHEVAHVVLTSQVHHSHHVVAADDKEV